MREWASKPIVACWGFFVDAAKLRCLIDREMRPCVDTVFDQRLLKEGVKFLNV